MAVSNVELRVGATQAITALKNVNTQAQKFNQTVNGTNSKLKDANKALPMLSKGFFGSGVAAKGAAISFKAAGVALATALAPLAAGITLVAALGKVFTDLSAQDFASARVKTLGVDVDNLKPKLQSLSNELSGQVSSLDLLAASYDVASAGFGEVAELSDVLKASQLGATGGFSELATVADATTSVLNAYGLESDQAAKLVDGFIQTQNDGKIVVDQYAQQIGRLAPIAAGAGVGIDELNAAISTVTATGVPVESTFAGLRQVIASIQKPTSEAAKAAEKLGVDFSATALSTKGLGGVLEELVAKGGASEETLAQFFGSVEARTAILPLLNDQLVSFNKNLENQANSQGKAAEASTTSSNTIQGQLTRLSSAFTNLTTDGSEFGIIIREVFKVAAVTVEGLGIAFQVVGDIVRGVIGVVGEIGKVFTKSIGIDAVGTLISLEQGWINVKEQVTKFGDEIIFVGKVIGGVIGQSLKISFNAVKDFLSNFNTGLNILKAQFIELTDGIKQRFVDLVSPIVKVFQKIVDAIPEPVKKLLGGAAKFAIPTIDFSTGNLQNPFKNLKNPFKDLGKDLEFVKEGLIEFSGIEREISDEVNKQVDAKNKILATNGKIKTSVEAITPAEKQAREEADKLKETFREIGSSVRNDLVNNLTDAITEGKSFGDAMKNVLGNLKKRLVNLAIDRAISGIGRSLSGGGGFGGFLGGLFGGRKERGGRVSAGGAFVVGERGPEILQMGSKGGNIIPNSAIGKGGGTTTNLVTVNVDASGSSVSGNTADANQLGQVIGQAVQAQLIKEKRAGGLLTR